MDVEIQKPEPKISEVELILIGLFFFILDCIDFIPGAGDVTDVIAAPMGFYYWIKKLNGVVFIVSEAVEAIPGAQEFPFIRSIAWGITIWADRHPKALGKLEAGIELAAALEGSIEAEESLAPGATGGPQGKTLDMTKGESGAYEHQPGTSGQENAKPSEKSTERGGGSSGAAEGDVKAGKTPEQQRQEAENLRYKEMTDPEGARDPMKEAEKKLFAEPGPGKEQAPDVPEEPKPKEEPRQPSSPAKKSLDDRFAEFQKRTRPQDASQPQASEDQDEDIQKAA